MPLVFYGLTSLACGGGGRRGTFPGAILMAMTAAIMTRPALVRPAAGPPDLYQFGSGNRIVRRGGNRRIDRCAIAPGSGLDCCFSTSLILRRFYWRSFYWHSFDRRRRFQQNFNRFAFSRFGFDRGRLVCNCRR